MLVRMLGVVYFHQKGKQYGAHILSKKFNSGD